MPDNATLLQGFEWNCPADGKHYERLHNALPNLKACGIDNMWLPPGCKASSQEGNGYDIYDLYDLGEFNQKGGVRTKWGSKEDLLALSRKAQELGLGLYWDAVLNHKAGADKKEKVRAVEVDAMDRNRDTSEPYEIQAWLGFEFPGRGEKYSKQKYHWYHFSGTDYNAANGKKAIYKLQGEGKDWSESVDDEQGNADYMMFADLDYSHPEVEEDVKSWGEWIVNELKLKGFRLDAVQHFSERFTNEWVEHVRARCGEDIFMVGEFWVGDEGAMCKWLDKMNRKFSLFDAPLLYNFSRLSTTEDADLRTVFDNTLVKVEPVNTVVSHLPTGHEEGRAFSLNLSFVDCSHEPRHATGADHGHEDRRLLQTSCLRPHSPKRCWLPVRVLRRPLRHEGRDTRTAGLRWQARRHDTGEEAFRVRPAGRILRQAELHRLCQARDQGAFGRPGVCNVQCRAWRDSYVRWRYAQRTKMDRFASMGEG
jgi:glycosidase